MSDLMQLARAVASRAQDRSRSTVTANAGALRAAADTISVAIPADACGACANFRTNPGTIYGYCSRYKVETWGQYGGGCLNGFIPADNAAREIERRRAAVANRLRADRTLRYSFDVQGATPRGPASGPVSVMLGMRDQVFGIVTAELQVPAERWDMAAFMEYLHAQERPS